MKKCHPKCYDQACVFCKEGRRVCVDPGCLVCVVNEQRRFDINIMNPKEFLTPDLFTVIGDRPYHKFDEISIFFAPAAGSMVVAFYLRGKQVYWTPLPQMPAIKGEVTLTDLVGWQGLTM